MTTSATKMHDDELDIDAELVEGLVADQFPRWAGLPVRRVPSAGTENAMFRLGDDMVVRLPRRPDGARQIEKEHRWMPHLAPHLPLAVPEPLAKGVPGPGYALAWGVYRWLEGEDAYNKPIQQLTEAARELGGFITALRQIDATTGPPSYRGGPLTADDDTDVRDAIRDLGADGTLDAEPATEAWESALRLPRGTAPPSGSTATSSRATSSPPPAASPQSSTSEHSAPETPRWTPWPPGQSSTPKPGTPSETRQRWTTRPGAEPEAGP